MLSQATYRQEGRFTGERTLKQRSFFSYLSELAQRDQLESTAVLHR